jgi:hypothetical protein
MKQTNKQTNRQQHSLLFKKAYEGGIVRTHIPYMDIGPALSQLDQLLPIGSHDRVVYSRMFKYTQQYTAGFTENNWYPYLLIPTLNEYTIH